MITLQVALEYGTLDGTSPSGTAYSSMKTNTGELTRVRSINLVKGLGSYTISVNSDYSIFMCYFSGNTYSGSYSSWSQTKTGSNLCAAIAIKKNDESNITSLEDVGLVVQVETSLYWHLDENDILTNEYLPDALSWEPPYPLGKWYLDENDIIQCAGMPKNIGWAPPYPLGKWYLDENDILTCSGLPDALIDDQGAFAGLTNLTDIRIPNSVKSIGRYSFRDTGLFEVTLANDCTYYTTSFPPTCTVIGGQLIT